MEKLQSILKQFSDLILIKKTYKLDSLISLKVTSPINQTDKINPGYSESYIFF